MHKSSIKVIFDPLTLNPCVYFICIFTAKKRMDNYNVCRVFVMRGSSNTKTIKSLDNGEQNIKLVIQMVSYNGIFCYVEKWFYYT